MRKIKTSIHQIIKYMNITVMFSMFSILIIQVFTRKFLNDPLSWPEELSLVAMIWITFFGAYQCTVEGSHLKMDLLQDRLVGKQKTIVAILSKCIVIWFLVVTCYWGFDFIQQAGKTKMPVSGIPMWVPYWIIWTSFFLMMIDYVIQIITHVKELIGSKKAEEDEKCSPS